MAWRNQAIAAALAAALVGGFGAGYYLSRPPVSQQTFELKDGHFVIVDANGARKVIQPSIFAPPVAGEAGESRNSSAAPEAGVPSAPGNTR